MGFSAGLSAGFPPGGISDRYPRQAHESTSPLRAQVTFAASFFGFCSIAKENCALADSEGNTTRDLRADARRS